MMFKNLEEITKTKFINKICSILYLGQEGVLFNLNGLSFCIDPYLSDYVDKNCCTDVIKWKRLYDSEIKGNDLDFVDYFLFTHTHFDHCDPWTIKDILSTNKKAKFIIGINNVEALKNYGVDQSRIIPISIKEQLKINDVSVSAFPAKHDIFHENNGEYDELCFSLTYKDFKVFHAGDTLDYDDLFKYMEHSNVCFLPINGRDDFRTRNDVIGNLNPEEAFKLTLNSKSSLLIPIHNDLYDINCSPDVEIKNAIKKYKDVNYKFMKHGEILKVDISK